MYFFKMSTLSNNDKETILNNYVIDGRKLFRKRVYLAWKRTNLNEEFRNVTWWEWATTIGVDIGEGSVTLDPDDAQSIEILASRAPANIVVVEASNKKKKKKKKKGRTGKKFDTKSIRTSTGQFGKFIKNRRARDNKGRFIRADEVEEIAEYIINSYDDDEESKERNEEIEKNINSGSNSSSTPGTQRTVPNAEREKLEAALLKKEREVEDLEQQVEEENRNTTRTSETQNEIKLRRAREEVQSLREQVNAGGRDDEMPTMEDGDGGSPNRQNSDSAGGNVINNDNQSNFNDDDDDDFGNAPSNQTSANISNDPHVSEHTSEMGASDTNPHI